MRWTVLFVFIGVASALRGFGVPVIYSTGIAVFAGCVGIMIIGSCLKGVMLPCIALPIVRRGLWLCIWNKCLRGDCVWTIVADIAWLVRGCVGMGSVESRRAERRPAINCTLCGDCLAGCRHDALEYHFWGISPILAERLWLGTTLVLFTCFLSIARV